MIEFHWDERKNRSNFHKYGLWFEEAQTIWADERAIEFFDTRNSEEEDRFLRMGFSTKGRLVLVAFSERNEGKTVRLISARKPTFTERMQYEKRV